jgi:hypothetical protein
MGVKVFIIFFGLHGGRLSSAIKIKSRGVIRYGRGIFLFFLKFCSNPIRAQFSLCFLTPIGEITLLVPLHQFTCHFGESCNHARTHRVVMFPHLKRFLCVCVCVAKSCCFLLASVVDVTPRFQKIYICSLWLFGWRGRKNRKMNRWFPPWVSSSGRSPCFRRWLAIMYSVVHYTAFGGLITDVTTTIDDYPLIPFGFDRIITFFSFSPLGLTG